MGRPRKHGYTKAEIRHAEVSREFEAQQSSIDPEDNPDPRYIYLPRWRFRMPNGKLSPRYGPLSLAAYNREIAQYRESIFGGGLIDHQESMTETTRQKLEAAKKQRYDALKMERFINANSHKVPVRELEVYLLYYQHGLSKGQAAREMGISKKTFENYLLVLRRRMKGRLPTNTQPIGAPGDPIVGADDPE